MDQTVKTLVSKAMANLGQVSVGQGFSFLDLLPKIILSQYSDETISAASEEFNKFVSNSKYFESFGYFDYIKTYKFKRTKELPPYENHTVVYEEYFRPYAKEAHKNAMCLDVGTVFVLKDVVTLSWGELSNHEKGIISKLFMRFKSVFSNHPKDGDKCIKHGCGNTDTEYRIEIYKEDKSYLDRLNKRSVNNG